MGIKERMELGEALDSKRGWNPALSQEERDAEFEALHEKISILIEALGGDPMPALGGWDTYDRTLWVSISPSDLPYVYRPEFIFSVAQVLSSKRIWKMWRIWIGWGGLNPYEGMAVLSCGWVTSDGRGGFSAEGKSKLKDALEKLVGRYYIQYMCSEKLWALEKNCVRERFLVSDPKRVKALVVLGRSKVPLVTPCLRGGGYHGPYNGKNGETSFCSIWAFVPFRKKFDFGEAIWNAGYFEAAILGRGEGAGKSLEVRPSSRCGVIILERPSRKNIIFFVGEEYFRDPEWKKEGVIFSFFVEKLEGVGDVLAIRKRGYKRTVPIDKKNIVNLEVGLESWGGMRSFSST